MTSTYSANLGIELMGTGDQSGTWGTTTNNNLGTLLEQSIVGYVSQAVTDGADTTILITNGSSSVGRNYVINLTGALTANRNVLVPAVNKTYVFVNSTTGGFSVTVKVTGQTGVTIANGKKALVYVNGVDVIEIANAPVTEAGTQTLINKTLNAATLTGTVTATTITSPAATNLTIQSAGTTAMTIDTSQNVGIGGSPSSFKFFVTGTASGLLTRVTDAVAQSYDIGTTSAGVYFNTPNNGYYAWQTNSAERMRIDTSGNVGIGTTSPNAKLNVYSSSSTANLTQWNGGTSDASFITIAKSGTTGGTAGTPQFSLGMDYSTTYVDLTAIKFARDSGAGGNMQFFTGVNANGAERMRIDSSGNVGIGTNSPVATGGLLQVSGKGNEASARFTGNANGMSVVNQSGLTVYTNLSAGSADSTLVAGNTAGTYMAFGIHNGTSYSERMRIDTSGNLLVGGTSADAKFVVTNTTNTPVGRIYSSATSGYTSETFQVIAGQPSGTGFKLASFYTNNAAAYAAYIRGDGTIFAVSTTIQAISDERTKENIVSSNDGLNVISALRPVRFDFKEGFGNGKQNQLGFIAQEMEQVFPEAVDEWGESDDPDKPYKSVGSGTLIPVLVKAIQELKATVDAQAAEITALKTKVGI